MEIHPFLIFLLIVAVIIVFGIVNVLLAAKRRNELAAWARTKRLNFNPAKNYDVERMYAFPCLEQGDNRYAYNMMDGDWGGRAITAFDYHYETHTHNSKGGRSTHHHRFSAVILQTDVPLKPLFVRPEGIWDKITEFIGFDDIDFESAEFSRKFYVKAEDKRWAYDVIHPRVMEFLLAAPRFPIQFGPDCVIAYRGSTFSTLDFESAAGVIGGILDRLPEYLVKQQKETG